MFWCLDGNAKGMRRCVLRVPPSLIHTFGLALGAVGGRLCVRVRRDPAGNRRAGVGSHAICGSRRADYILVAPKGLGVLCRVPLPVCPEVTVFCVCVCPRRAPTAVQCAMSAPTKRGQAPFMMTNLMARQTSILLAHMCKSTGTKTRYGMMGWCSSVRSTTTRHRNDSACGDPTCLCFTS